MPSLLAVLASGVWGGSDFAGATLSKRWSSTAVVFLGIVLALLVLTLGIPLAHPPFGAYQWYGIGAGAGGAVAMACFYYIFFALGSTTSVYGTLLGQRFAGPVALFGLRRGKSLVNGLEWSPRIVALLLFNGLGDVAANGLYGIATRHAGGNLPVVMALSGLYPVVSTVLAWALLKERLRPVQNLGILAALTAVLLLNA